MVLRTQSFKTAWEFWHNKFNYTLCWNIQDKIVSMNAKGRERMQKKKKENNNNTVFLAYFQGALFNMFTY